MKVRISFTLDIDAESWALNYGIEDRAEIREDAKQKAERDLREHWGPGNLDLLMDRESFR